VDSESIYWADNANGIGNNAIVKAPRTGGAATTLASDLDWPVAVAAGTLGVYWTDVVDGTVMTVPSDGGRIVTLSSGQNTPQTIAIDSSSIYWGTGPPLDSSGTGEGAIVKVPLGGGIATTLVGEQFEIGDLAVYDASVYWTTGGGGTVMQMPVDGGTPRTLASAQVASAIAVSGAAVCWSDSTGGRVVALLQK
jgi:hypothetical protein